MFLKINYKIILHLRHIITVFQVFELALCISYMPLQSHPLDLTALVTFNKRTNYKVPQYTFSPVLITSPVLHRRRKK